MTADLCALVAALQSGDVAQQQSAAEELARLGSDARPAAVALVEACQRSDDELHEWVVAALEGLGPPQPADLERLTALLGSPSLDAAYWAVTLLGRLGARAAPAVPELVDTLAGHNQLAVRQRAAWALGQVGPAASTALEKLRTAAGSSDRRLASLARDAIASIRG